MIGKLEQVGRTYGKLLEVYRRTWREIGLRHYVVIRTTDGKVLEEFQNKRDALRWAEMEGRRG